MTFNASMHPRAPKGPGGGEFAGSSSSSKSTAAKPGTKRPAARAARGRMVPKGSLGFDGKTGTGYGKKGGDARVKAMQKRMNALGITDAQGHPLKVDGMLGPKTTAAIKAWQKRNKMPVTGTVDAASLKKLTAARSKTAHLRRAKPKVSAAAASG